LPLPALLPDSARITLQDILIDGERITLVAQAIGSHSPCPQCGKLSSRVHSRYTRTLADLPWQGRAVRIELQVRRFFCTAAACSRRTFAERLPEVAAVSARTTARLHETHRLIGQALGGEAGSRLAVPLGLPTSPDTLLRRVRRASPSQQPAVRVLGVDDWAWKRGRRYGTILCDLERRRPVDLLPERSADSFAPWLKAHPGVEIISRDRGDEDIKGANQGAPEAVQVADRWHLLVNLREALMRAVDRQHGHVLEAARAVAASQGPEPLPARTPTSGPGEERLPPDHRTARGQQRRARRLERYRRVVELNEQGVSLRGIARRMGMHRATVRHGLHAGSFPERAGRHVTSRTDRFLDYLRRRWDEGCHNAAQWVREIQAMGFGGTAVMVRRRVARWRRGERTEGCRPASRRHAPSLRRPSSRRVSCWLLKEPAEREPEEQALVQAMGDRCAELKASAELAREFVGMVRQRRAGEWEKWMTKAQGPGVARELSGFAEGLKQDEAAVKAASSLEWSHGQVEGQVNRLKLLKRQMYGRAGFDLLRRRVLEAGRGQLTDRTPWTGPGSRSARQARQARVRSADSVGDRRRCRASSVGFRFAESKNADHIKRGRTSIWGPLQIASAKGVPVIHGRLARLGGSDNSWTDQSREGRASFVADRFLTHRRLDNRAGCPAQATPMVRREGLSESLTPAPG
jgi:transposase